MMLATNTEIKHAFQQLSGALKDAFSPPPANTKPWAFGSSIAFMTTTFALCKQLNTEGRLPSTLEAAHQGVIADAVKNNHLAITQADSTPQGIADPDAANFRHLRNAFAHGNWTRDQSLVPSGAPRQDMKIILEDYSPRQSTPNWRATIDFADLVNMAEKLLVETFNGMP
jgi:hypothetical protein